MVLSISQFHLFVSMSLKTNIEKKLDQNNTLSISVHRHTNTEMGRSLNHWGYTNYTFKAIRNVTGKGEGERRRYDCGQNPVQFLVKRNSGIKLRNSPPANCTTYKIIFCLRLNSSENSKKIRSFQNIYCIDSVL